MLFLVSKGYRVIALDRRGHGRSSQVSDGHDMDHYAADSSRGLKEAGIGEMVATFIKCAREIP